MVEDLQSRHTPSASVPRDRVEQWAHWEAKSDAMVEEVFELAGARPTVLSVSPRARRVRVAAALAALGATLLLAEIWIVRTLESSSNSASDRPVQATDGAAQQANATERRQFWGPFRP